MQVEYASTSRIIGYDIPPGGTGISGIMMRSRFDDKDMAVVYHRPVNSRPVVNKFVRKGPSFWGLVFFNLMVQWSVRPSS